MVKKNRIHIFFYPDKNELNRYKTDQKKKKFSERKTAKLFGQ